MEQFDYDELSDQELKHVLSEWKAPLAPARLRRSVFPHAPENWWKQFWNKSIRVPLPAAIAIALVLVFTVWRWPALVGHRMVPEVQTPAAPANDVPANRRRPAQDREQLRPVMELKPVIIRRTE